MKIRYIGESIIGIYFGGATLIKNKVYEVAVDNRSRNGTVAIYDENNILEPIDESKFVVEEEIKI